MGFGGATQAMISIIRNNRNMLSNRKAQRDSLKKLDATYSEGVQRKEFSLQEVEQAKRQIRKTAAREERKSLLVLIVTIIATPLVIYGVFWLLGELSKLQ